MPNISEEDEINLLDLYQILKKKWLCFLLMWPIVGIIAFGILIFIPNIYVSEVFLTPSAHSQEDGPSNSSLSAVGAIAGIDFNDGQNADVRIALEIIQSRKFAIDFVKNHNLKIELFAIKEWDGNNYSIDESIYDVAAKKWVRDVSPPKLPEPQDWEVYEEFSNLLTVNEDDDGFITILFEGKTPVIVQTWLEMIVEDINSIMRGRAQGELERSMEFLQQKLRTVELQDIRQAFARLMEDQTRKLMMTESRENFVLEVIDPAYQPVKPAKPQRLLIMLAAMVMFTILMGLFVIFRELNATHSNEITEEKG